MADAKETQTYKCSLCQEMMPKSTYSGKQLKKKGKRKCNECVQAVQAEASLELEQKAKNPLLNNDHKGKAIVKTAKAADIAKSQEKLGTNLDSPDDDRFDRLLRWLKDGGSKFPNLVLKYYTVDYRGVHARKRLENNECILEVPLPLIMTTDVAMASEIGQRIRSSGCELRSSHSWLACLLLHEKEKGDQSFFKPYIDILPVHYRNMPIFFDDEELTELKGSFTLKMISDRKISLKMEYDNIVQYVPEFSRFHYLEFFWARLAVITRIFGFNVAGKKTDGLVAMADMLNHKRPNETSWTFEDSKNAFTITTTKRLLKGAQIFDSYGRKCNSRFFVNYGFTLDFNEDNQVSMLFSIPESKDPDLDKAKQRLVRQRHRRFQIPFEHKEKITRHCMSFLRIANATPEELIPLMTNKSLDTTNIKPISPANEARCIYHVEEVAKQTLAGFDTTLEEDYKLLDSPDLTMNIRNCLVQRRGEKEVLNAHINLATHLREVEGKELREVKKYVARNIKGRGREPSFDWRLENWFADVWIPLLQGETKFEWEEMNNSLGV
jgi:histone-lysine N-methyltransferase SETD3